MSTLPPTGSTTPYSLFAVWPASDVPIADTSLSAQTRAADRGMASDGTFGADQLLESHSADRRSHWQTAHIKRCNAPSRTIRTKVLA